MGSTTAASATATATVTAGPTCRRWPPFRLEEGTSSASASASASASTNNNNNNNNVWRSCRRRSPHRASSWMWLAVCCHSTWTMIPSVADAFRVPRTRTQTIRPAPTPMRRDKRVGPNREALFASTSPASVVGRSIRCYSSSSSSSLSPSNVDDERHLRADRSAISNLPRLYVNPSFGPRATTDGDSSSPFASTTTVSMTALSARTVVPLTPNQSHYLQVMRITNPKRWGVWAGHLRLFNGQDGEWLAKVLVDSSGGGGASSSSVGAGSSKKQRRRPPRGGGGGASEEATVVECLERLRPQHADPKDHTSSSTRTQQQQQQQVVLHMGRLKKPRRKWVLEKATELGIDGIQVVDTEFSSTQDAWEYDKHLLQVVEAAEQCERLTLPDLATAPQSWTELRRTIQESVDVTAVAVATDGGGTEEEGTLHHWLICRERSPDSLPILQVLRTMTTSAKSSSSSSIEKAISVHVLIGPEGGWSPQELQDMEGLIQEQPSQVHFVSLGPTVLRAETAAISALSAVVLSFEAPFV